MINQTRSREGSSPHVFTSLFLPRRTQCWNLISSVTTPNQSLQPPRGAGASREEKPLVLRVLNKCMGLCAAESDTN